MAEKKSELQKAADRVREMQVAVDKMEKNLKVCEGEYSSLKLKTEEAYRNLADTAGLLKAQKDKLNRETQAALDILHGSNLGVAWGHPVNGMCEKVDRY